jgi:hypothetical protein
MTPLQWAGLVVCAAVTVWSFVPYWAITRGLSLGFITEADLTPEGQWTLPSER